jgi:protein ImuB
MHAVIYIPNFHLQAALRLEPELRARPVALMDDHEPKSAVMQMTDLARASGITVGQTSTQAMARCREVIIRPRARAREEAVAEILLQCAYCFSPRIEATADGVCTLDLRGLPVVAALGQGNVDAATEWAERILRALEQTGLHAQIGLAETPPLAWQAARRAAPILCVTDPDAFIASLPIESLNPPPPIADILERWGIRNVRSFLALGKDKIAERLGSEAVEMCDRALTRESRPLKLVTPAETFEEFMEFEQPLEMLEPLLFVLRRFVEQLVRRLDTLYVVTQELRLRLGLISGDAYERVFVIPAPTRDVDALFRMLHTHLENVRTESPIHSLRLAAKPGRAGNYQFGLFETALRDPNQFHETLARLGALVGEGHAGAPHLIPTHRPDAFALDVERISRDAFGDLELENESSAPAAPQQTCGLALRRFRPPLPAVVELREGRPAVLHSSAFSDAIVQTQGPWRISGDWWDNGRWTREEWEAQTRDGELCRLLRIDDRWFLDGLFD